jgi:hypothetical protein
MLFFYNGFINNKNNICFMIPDNDLIPNNTLTISTLIVCYSVITHKPSIFFNKLLILKSLKLLKNLQNLRNLRTYCINSFLITSLIVLKTIYLIHFL